MSYIEKLKKAQTEAKKQLELENVGDEQISSPTLSIFDFLTEITTKKTKWEDLGEANQKSFNPYAFEKIVLSMVPEFVVFLAETQQIKNEFTPEQYYKYLYYFLPKMNFPCKYIKKTIVNKPSKEVMSVLKSYFEEKEKNILNYYKMLQPSKVIQILKNYGWSEEKINKNLKTS